MMLKSLVLFLVFDFLPVFIFGSHFRGGTISWRYTGSGNQVEFKFRLAWVLNSADTSGSWNAEMPGFSTNISTVAYMQTETNNVEKWEQGEKTFTFNFNSFGPYRVYYSSGDWTTLSYGVGGGWTLQTIVDLHQRSDTHQPNNSPLTTSRAMYRAQYGCPITIQIPMTDIDGDTVRCRWATAAEANSISQLLPNARLDEVKCKLEFTAIAANNYTNNGWYAVALTIEDFPKRTITINGKVYTPSTPISSIPLQFLIKAETLPGSCDDKPKFVVSTPAEGSIIVLKATTSMSEKFYLQSNVGLNSIDVSGPIGMMKFGISPDNHGRSNVWYVLITWTPNQSHQGTHIICGYAEDRNMKLSDTRCFTVIAWDIDPCDSQPCKNKGTCDRFGYTKDYRCLCVPGFTGSLCETNINECASSPCRNGGKCLDLINEYRCHCLAGYTATNCQSNIDECHSTPCQHGSRCIDGVNSYTCSCYAGYVGTHCEIDIDECHSYPCYNNATCVDGIASWSCSCQPGFTGVQCQTDINECMSNPCQHNGTCIDSVNDFSCHCNNESAGEYCQLWLDHCSPNPCLHGGSCNNHYGGYTCHCADSWYGDICEYKEINKTEVCTDLDYTECSCVITRLRKPKSYRILSGSIGFITGLIGTVLAYTLWMCRSCLNHQINKIWPKSFSKDTNLFESEDLKSVDAMSMPDSKDESTVNSAGPIHCDCFVDHSGYDHFKRFDAKNSRFRFNTCRHERKDLKTQIKPNIKIK